MAYTASTQSAGSHARQLLVVAVAGIGDAAQGRQYRVAAFHGAEVPGALVGFGIAFDPRLGRARNWYQNAGDVKRWADNDQPVEEVQT